VKPDPGLESLLTNQQNELVILARRKRDFLPWDKLATIAAGTKRGPGAPPIAPPSPSTANPPVPEPDDEGQTAEKTPSPDSQAAEAAKQDPATIDPQLQKAIEHLQQEISGRTGQQPLL